MKKAHDALMAYVERQSKGHDLDLHRRLAAELKRTTDNYYKVVLALNSR